MAKEYTYFYSLEYTDFSLTSGWIKRSDVISTTTQVVSSKSYEELVSQIRQYESLTKVRVTVINLSLVGERDVDN